MNLPTGLTLRPEFRPQHDKGKEAPPGKASTPPPSGNGGSKESPAKKQDPNAKGQQDACMQQMWILLPLILVFYFVLMRPQQKQEKQLKAMRSSLKKGDRVVTSGGMHGVVASVDDAVVTIRPSADGPSMIFDASAIGRVIRDEKEEAGKDTGAKDKGAKAG